MKTGRNIVDLAKELQRQVESKHDYLVPTEKVRMTDKATLASVNGDKFPEVALTPWAHQQMAQDLEIPKPYYDRMLEQRPTLLAENVNAWLHAEDRTRLLRTLDSGGRAWLSDRYRPLDNVDLAEAAFPVLRDLGTEIKSAELTDTRLYIKAVKPTMQADIVLRHAAAVRAAGGHEYDAGRGVRHAVAAGVSLRNSEVGHGAVALEFFLEILVCSNLAMMTKALRKYHIGRRAGELEGDGIEEFLSNETRRLDDRAFWSKFSDVLTGAFNQQTFDRLIAKAQDAADTPITATIPDIVEITARKFTLTETEKSSVLTHLSAGGDLSQWGLSNAITRASQDADQYERATELERIGGEIIELPKHEFAALQKAA